MHGILPKVIEITIKYQQQLRNNTILSHALFINAQKCDAPLYIYILQALQDPPLRSRLAAPNKSTTNREKSENSVFVQKGLL